MGKIFFTAWLLINGMWVHGSEVDGWHSFNLVTEERCQAALEYAAEHGPEGVKFTCERTQNGK